MKSYILVVVIALAGVSSQADESKNEQRVSGNIEIEEGAKSGGELFLTVVPAGSELIKVEKADSEKDESKGKKSQELKLPDQSGPKTISLGRNNGKTTSFSVDLVPGNYRLGCLVKVSDPPCSSITINDKKTTQQCLPGKDDGACASVLVRVDNKSVSNVTLRLGLNEK